MNNMTAQLRRPGLHKPLSILRILGKNKLNVLVQITFLCLPPIHVQYRKF